jgi:hypothetical protein
MHKTLRFFAVLGAAAGIYLAAALQSGPTEVDANICATARRWHIAVPEQCAPWIDSWARLFVGLVLLLCLGFLAWDLWTYLRSRPPRQKRALGSQRYIDVMEAIYWIAEKSAWGRWKEARYQVSGKAVAEIFKLTTAERLLTTAAANGELVVKGRLAKSVDYKDLDQHFWRSAFLGIQQNSVTRWQVAIKARPAMDVAIPEYDSFIVESTRVRALWRRQDWRYDLPALRLKFRSMLRRMKDQKSNEPQKATGEAPAGPPPAAPVTHHVVAEAGIGIETTVETTVSAGANVEITVTAAAPENWERLFAIGDDGRSVWLRFLPDTKNYRADTLLLIVYGQKVLRDVSRVRIDAAHAAVEKTVSNAPNRFNTTSGFLTAMMLIGQMQAAANLDWVDKCVPEYLERVGLSQGGFYQLTADGKSRAAGLAYDLIRRA